MTTKWCVSFYFINQYVTIMYWCIISSFLADIDIKSTSSAQDKANKEVECQPNPSEGDLSTIKDEIDSPVVSIFRLKVKKMKSRELVSKIIEDAAKDQFDFKKYRVQSVSGINVVENRPWTIKSQINLSFCYYNQI